MHIEELQIMMAVTKDSISNTNIISCSLDPVRSYFNKSIQILLPISRIKEILRCFVFYLHSIFRILDNLNLNSETSGKKYPSAHIYLSPKISPTKKQFYYLIDRPLVPFFIGCPTNKKLYWCGLIINE